MTAEYPIPDSAIGSVYGTDGSLPPQISGTPTPETAGSDLATVAELIPAEQVVADALRAKVSQIFAGVDTDTPGTYGYNTYVDRKGEGTRATRFRDGSVVASFDKGPRSTSYRLHAHLFGNHDGYQRQILSFDDLSIGRSVSLIRTENRDPQKGDEPVTAIAEITRVAREDFGLGV